MTSAIVRLCLMWAAKAGLIAGLFLVMAVTAIAEHAQISKRRLAERKAFTDAEIADGFFRTAFGAELLLAGASNRIRKYDGPVRVRVESRARPDRRAAVAKVVADIGAHVRHLDIAMAANGEPANVTVMLVRDRDLATTIHRLFGRERARRIARSLVPQCLSGFSKDETFRIQSSQVILVVDTGEFTFYDCAYEEILQSLGPINDTDAVPWTMFNDKVKMGFFDVFDQFILNILYDPRIRPGMTAEEVRAILPKLMPDVREWVEKVNQP